MRQQAAAAAAQFQLSPEIHTATSNTGLARSTVLGQPVEHHRNACGYPRLVTMQAAHGASCGTGERKRGAGRFQKRQESKEGKYLVAPEEVMRLSALGSVTSR